jgi:hypothetical protein
MILYLLDATTHLSQIVMLARFAGLLRCDVGVVGIILDHMEYTSTYPSVVYIRGLTVDNWLRPIFISPSLHLVWSLWIV